LNAMEAAEQAAQDVPVPDGIDAAWDTDTSAVESYDPCAPLSQITLTLAEATASSPFVVLLFHEGEYVGTATEQAYPFEPTIERIDPSSLRIIYAYAQDGDVNAAPSGEAIATVTWDDTAQSIVFDGDLPPR
jgi:hypothetical protein